MKVLTSLLRVIFSIVVLLALACYLQAAPTVSLSQFCLSIEPTQLIELLSGFNAVTITLVIILLLGILSFTRVLEAAWNVLFCAAVLGLLITGLYTLGGPSIALPNALYHNEDINHICQSLTSYEVPIAIAILIFLAGWVCASACGRVLITAVVSFGLWYALTEFFTYIVHQWANSSAPAMPEALNMIQGSPWIIAAVPGSFFLIYALLMALFETFIGSAPKAGKAPVTDEPQPEEGKAKEVIISGQKAEEPTPEPQAAPEPTPEKEPETEPVQATPATVQETTEEEAPVSVPEEATPETPAVLDTQEPAAQVEPTPENSQEPEATQEKPAEEKAEDTAETDAAAKS